MSENPQIARALRLRTLGGLAVECDPGPGPGAATQRRPLALLALLAAAGARGASRDKLLGCLWPESSEEKARHLLTQTLYALRRDLHAEALFLGSSDLKLNRDLIWVDVQEFEAALERDQVEQAVTLYRGPFLDGFFLSGAPEFERWVAGERDRLARRASRALETLAAAGTTRGEHATAAEWWRRLTQQDPLNSRFALGLIEALAAAGDRAGALRHAREHERLLKAELDVSPDPALATLVARLRAEAGPGVSSERPAVRGARRDRAASVAAALADRYTIERELGRGGTTAVYLARDARHGRPVALKVLHPELGSALAAARFLRQIRLVAPLRHPHVLPLYDSGDADGVLFYVTPYVEGGSLRARLVRERTLAVPEAVRLAREAAEALDYAHAHNVLHRNIKPEHILLDGGHAVVGGFGIVRALEAAREDHLTAEGLRMGTPAYMSPEQAACDPDLDGRSDLYGLGCVLYELLSSAPPPRAEPPPRVRPIRPEVPEALDAALARALSRAPADRFATAAQFARALAGTDPA